MGTEQNILDPAVESHWLLKSSTIKFWAMRVSCSDRGHVEESSNSVEGCAQLMMDDNAHDSANFSVWSLAVYQSPSISDRKRMEYRFQQAIAYPKVPWIRTIR